jgi:hypothetical protein
MMTTAKLTLALFAPLALAPAFAQRAHDEAPPTQTITLDAQGHSPEWEQSAHWQEFYSLSVERLRDTPAPDVGSYEQKSYEIFRAFARSMGASPDGMIEHLKNIPREIVGIVKDDPKVLDSYESFLVALRGPR